MLEFRKLDYVMLGIIGFILFLVIRMNKTMNAQSILLIGIAERLGVTPARELNINTQRETSDSTNTTESTNDQQSSNELNEEEKKIMNEMIRISDKIKAKEALSEKEVELYNKFFDILSSDLNLAEISKEGEEIKEKTKEEAKEKGNKTPPVIVKRVSGEEKERIVFDDLKSTLTPKIVGEIAKLIAKATDTKPTDGNTYNFLVTLLKSGKLKTFETYHNKKNKVFYALPEWFDGKKLKKEILKNIK